MDVMAAETCACGALLDDGEGYAGRCGNCADRAENAAEKKRQAVIDTLRRLGYTASSELLERDPSWQEHFESLLSNKTREMTDEQRLAIWPHWTERWTTQTAPGGRTVTLTYAVVTTDERSVEAPLTCPGAECGADLTVENAITETWLVHCEFGGSFVAAKGEKPTYRNGYVYSAYRSGFATVGFCCAQCGSSLLP